jgi:photosynthetic reaction center cytochrome c subunit
MTIRVLALALTLVALQPAQPPATPQPQRWQPPDPVNLKVFPKDIPKPALIQAMRGFTQALGVRCEFCHVGEGNDLSKFDFASDERRQKRNARLMLAMVTDLNTNYLSEIPEPRPADKLAVTCFTCHRGETRPLTTRPEG